ncbi:CHASE2 domain-containing protein [Algibacillus agarilyticus]|uniref:CHASE2 domain-containing protein n=1 Tax=Algibacillus agarilyticus TaxID=2234133 RepID=UPI000DCF9BA4|nr:adenylate/guanylate cyclase domain-containing protein [Algibacillus agarilyticus]
MISRQKGAFLVTFIMFFIAVLHLISVFRLNVIDDFERFIYDQRLIMNMPNTVDERVVIANIDEASIREFGRWPWRRDVLAEFVNILFDHYQIKTLGFDMVFAEASDNTGVEILDILANSPIAEHALFPTAYENLKPQLAFDEQFSVSLADRNIVLGLVFEQKEAPFTNQLPLPLISLDTEIADKTALVKAQTFVANLPLLHQQATRSGFFDNPLLDIDGVFRRVPLVQQIESHLYPSLALSLAAAALNAQAINIEFAEQPNRLAVDAVSLDDYSIKTGEQAEVYVPYRGPEGSFNYLSVRDILQQTLPVEALANKVVLLGTNAAGLLDLRTTPFANTYPGVEVHANLISGILNQNLYQSPKHKLKFEIGLMLILTLVILSCSLLKDFRISLFCTLVLMASVIGLSQWYWLQLIVMPTATSLSLALSLFLSLMIYNLLAEVKQKKSIVKRFGQYVPPDLVSRMAQAPEQYQLESESKELTVLFCDLRDFTSISEQLTPEQLSVMMNLYLTEMTKIIHKHHGTIDKYMGDAIMAFWGAPIVDEQHAYHASLAAVEMLTSLTTLNKQLQKQQLPALKMGVGINTDVMFVGNMGSEFRMAYTVMGDAVNLASRLESLTKQYGSSILVGEKTKKSLDAINHNGFYLRILDSVQVKGKQRPVDIAELLTEQDDLALKNTIDDFIKLYKARRWHKARQALYRLHADFIIKDELHTLYMTRISFYETNPPPENWDGTFVYQNK